jgi:hypothetical protein
VDVSVAGDTDAYLALTENTSAGNSDYIEKSNGTISIDLSENNGDVDGSGFNVDAITRIDGLLNVRNQGTQSAFLSVDLSDIDLNGPGGGQADVAIEVATDPSSPGTTVVNGNIANGGGTSSVVPDPTNSSPNGYNLGQGNQVALNLVVDTRDYDPGASGNSFVQTTSGDDVVITAEQSDPSLSP